MKSINYKKKKTLLTLLVLLTISLSACSFRMMYGYLDWILPWYLDDYVTLTDQQEKLFDRATFKFLGWHRSVELPRYADFFNSLKDAQVEPMSRQQVLLFFDELTEMWLALLSESMPDLILLAQDLSDNQVKQISTALQSDHRNLEEKYGDRDDQEQRRYYREKMVENLEDWIGSISDKQKYLTNKWSLSRINTTQEWLAYRNSWREKFIGLLNERKNPAFSVKMQQFLLQPQQFYTESYRHAVQKNSHGFAQLIADISSTFTPEQRAYFQKELAGVIVDLNYLYNQEG